MSCGTCPFLTRNFGRPSPEGFVRATSGESAKGHVFYEWYSKKNLIRLWRDGLRKGNAMICHSTDPNASQYGGKNAVPGIEKICTGSLAALFQHLKFIEQLIKKGLSPREVQKQYREKAGAYPLTKEGQASWAWNFAIGKTDFPIGTDIPRSVDPSLLSDVSVPWQDDIINNPSK